MSEHAASTTPTPCFEWVAFEGGLPGADGTVAEPGTDQASVRPGMVTRDDQGRALALHYAPARWLVPEPDAWRLAALIEAEAAGRGVLTNVTGRWRVIRLPAQCPASTLQPVPHPLAAGMPVDLYLKDRDVAASWVFDCPVLVVRHGSQIETWVEASYESGFRAAC